MRELLEEYAALRARGPVGRAVVMQVWGSAPRAPGSSLLATPEGRMAGSVSGGCVETAAVEEIAGAIARGAPRKAGWGVTHERAWEMGLSCGGTIEVWIEPAVPAEILEAARRHEGSVVATVVGGSAPPGARLVILEDGSRTLVAGFPAGLADAVANRAVAALAALSSEVLSLEGPAGPVEVFLEVFPRRPTLLIFGGVHIAAALVHLARPLGFRTIVADGREGYLTRERFPEADELILGWPDEVFSRVGLDAATCVAVLTHDPKFDEPALRHALRSPARYVGAIGSRKTQAGRREKLRAEGFTEAEVARLHGPIGLDLGGRAPAEIALAIIAEITAVRYGKSVGSAGAAPSERSRTSPA